MAEEAVRIPNLVQPPLNTTFMGVLKGAADHHGLGLSEPMVFGLSGHAFLINIHTGLCPSGPYCWKRETALPLIANMGLKMTDLGFYGTGTADDAKAAVERRLKEVLDKGVPCSLLNLENQLVTGYDAAGFFTAKPWACNKDFPPDRLTSGSWKEFGKSYHASFFTLEKGTPADRRAAILASLDYGIDLHRNPARHSSEAYGAGPLAYSNWVAAVPAGGASHGNWWNATVWSECRMMAAAYFAEIGAAFPEAAPLCAELQADYKVIGGNLGRIADKALDPAEKIRLLNETRDREAAAIGKVERLRAALGGAP